MTSVEPAPATDTIRTRVSRMVIHAAMQKKMYGISVVMTDMLASLSNTDFAPLKNSKQTLNFSRKKLKYIS